MEALVRLDRRDYGRTRAWAVVCWRRGVPAPVGALAADFAGRAGDAPEVFAPRPGGWPACPVVLVELAVRRWRGERPCCFPAFGVARRAGRGVAWLFDRPLVLRAGPLELRCLADSGTLAVREWGRRAVRVRVLAEVVTGGGYCGERVLRDGRVWGRLAG